MSVFHTTWLDLSGQTSHIDLIILCGNSVVDLLPILSYLVLDSLCLNFPIRKREIVLSVNLGTALSVASGTQPFANVGCFLGFIPLNNSSW